MRYEKELRVLEGRVQVAPLQRRLEMYHHQNAKQTADLRRRMTTAEEQTKAVQEQLAQRDLDVRDALAPGNLDFELRDWSI